MTRVELRPSLRQRVPMRRFLLLGQTGVGKSSFVNSTFGSGSARTSAFEPCTSIVETYARHTAWGPVCVVDTPGLSEGSPKTDLHHLQLIKRYLMSNKIDVTLYVSRLDENRFRPSEGSALTAITRGLGSAIWEQSWIVFTFAGVVLPEKLETAWRHRLRDIQGYLTMETRDSAPFPGFRQVLLIDNYAADWHADVSEVASLLVALGAAPR